MGAGCSSDSDNPFAYSGTGHHVPPLKIALVGDPEVGKTCVALRFLKNQFSPMYIPTKKAVIESTVRKLNVPGHTVVSLTLWDIPGREDIDLHKSYFRNLDAAIVVVDMTEQTSIEMAPVWRQTVLNNTFLTRPVEDKAGQVHTTTMEETPVDKGTFPILLLGNKFDVIEQRIQAERLKKMMAERAKEEKKSSEEEDKEKQEIEENSRKIWSINGPITEEEKPECVKFLEKTAVDHNFHGSLMASARDGDGSVREAVQYLVRHVLEAKFAVNKYKPKDKASEQKKAKELEYEGLQLTHVKEFDHVFEMADVAVKKVAMLRDYHHKSFTKLKEMCMQAQILESGETSLEDCIIALKRNIGEGAELKVKKDEDFCKLEIVSKDEDFKPVKKMRVLMKLFHNEFANVCKAIQKECPVIDTNLQTMDARLSTMCEECWDAVAMVDNVPRSQAEIKEISSTIEQNRAKMQHACLESRSAIQIVEDSKKKIKAAFLW
ncbi:uncharacterized protein LOC117327253 isoform X2 [Pecten maximus]|uniref:uncharacterized protein LOC117327253 isoform X2 n=1 Tax=Pecten maximus TaxID=6579 RepID=UPI001458FD05|nr:uncharacterized protein LOC117327253 isoform X2 [Pecten maximus]